jgi:hypothetical protein
MGATMGIALSAYQGVSGYETAQRRASASSAAGQYQKTISNENARLAMGNAKDATQRGQLEEQRSRLETRQQIGSTRAGLAAQGVDVGSGSSADVQASEAGIGELDALTIRNNAAREAYGYQVEAAQDTREGRLAQFSGDAAASGYRAQGVSTLLTGLGNTAARAYSYQKDRQDLRNKQNRPR